jgi:hypothetical protein
MRHLIYNVRDSVVPINSSLLNITLYSSVIKTLVYNDAKYPVPFMTLSSTRWRSWLRKVAGSIRDGFIGIFHWHKSFGRTMALRSTQPLTEMSTGNVSWEVKVAGA